MRTWFWSPLWHTWLWSLGESSERGWCYTHFADGLQETYKGFRASEMAPALALGLSLILDNESGLGAVIDSLDVGAGFQSWPTGC